MTVAIVNVCFDPRLNHEVIRSQVVTRLQAQQQPVDRVFITNEAAGNVGTGLRNAIDLLSRSGEAIAMVAVLDHDDCVAAAAGMRQALSDRLGAVTEYVIGKGIRCQVAGGTVLTENNVVRWDGWPPANTGSGQFTMPSIFGPL